ncbi:MAG TPA: DUF4062 domain-containing protein [Longimicrobium sp.]|nr:DUF4062 domain-containing protein [Longimicrobium sp.]
MDKRYQVFLSSTYADLKDERRRVIQALMELDCIPAGMEIFPAADEEQWEFIKHVIDDCDYYVLIIGGRYGSLTAEGVSYTEKEYDYASQKGLRVLAFLHERPEEIPVGKSELDPELRAKLDSFRTRVSTGRLVRFWRSPEELPGLVALSLSKTIKAYPAVGWVRANLVTNVEVLSELNELRKRNIALEEELQELRVATPEPKPARVLAPLNSPILVTGTFTPFGKALPETFSVSVTWFEIFAAIAPLLLEHPNDALVKRHLSEYLLDRSGKRGKTSSINGSNFDTIKVQLMAYGFVSIRYNKTVQGGMALFWALTEAGMETMLELRTVGDVSV